MFGKKPAYFFLVLAIVSMVLGFTLAHTVASAAEPVKVYQSERMQEELVAAKTGAQ